MTQTTRSCCLFRGQAEDTDFHWLGTASVTSELVSYHKRDDLPAGGEHACDSIKGHQIWQDTTIVLTSVGCMDNKFRTMSEKNHCCCSSLASFWKAMWNLGADILTSHIGPVGDDGENPRGSDSIID